MDALFSSFSRVSGVGSVYLSQDCSQQTDQASLSMSLLDQFSSAHTLLPQVAIDSHPRFDQRGKATLRLDYSA